MRRTALMIMAAGSAFALTAAGASGLGTLTGGTTVATVNTGSVNVTTTSCTDSIDIVYLYVDSATKQQISGVRLAGAPAASSTCEGLTATVTLSDSAGTPYTRSGSAVFAPVDILGTMVERATITLNPTYNVVSNPLKLTSISVS